MLLNLNNWRCFESVSLKLPDSGFSISDQNGVGKTSVLSAIFSLYTTLPWTDQTLKNCLRYQQNYFGVKSQEVLFNGQLEPSGRLKTKQEILIEDFVKPLVLSYSPIDNQLLSLTRTKKINFIDQILGQVLPSYTANLKVLSKLLAHKQAMIKSVNEENQNIDQTLLNTINQSIWNFSFYFWEERNKFLDYLNTNLPKAEKWINLNFGTLSLKYLTTIETIHKTTLSFSDFHDLQKQSKHLDPKDTLQKIWQKELLVGRCMWGSQRDDFEVLLGGENVIDVLSRGQMRILILWLKYLSLSYAREKLDFNSKVWWLLDDAFNELDNNREQILVQEILTNVDWFMITSTRKNDICASFSLESLRV
jgi:recombinational DNA repair ATPase RecF